MLPPPRPSMVLVVAALGMGLLSTACHSARGVSLAASGKPLTMKVTGAGTLHSLTVSGPFADQDALRRYYGGTKMAPVWSIRPVDATLAADALPAIQYGVVSKAFVEEKGPAPALEVGKLYLVHAVINADGSPLSWGQNAVGSFALCVDVQAAQITEATCPGK